MTVSTPVAKNDGAVAVISQASDKSNGSSSGNKRSVESKLFRMGEPIFEQDKVKVYQCLQASGRLWSMKLVQVDSSDQLEEADVTPRNLEICNRIVDYIQRKLFRLQHPHLVKYVHARYDKDLRRRLV